MTDLTFKKLFQEYQESGLNVRDFCQNQDIAVSTFYYWMKKRAKKNEPPKEFVPLVIGGQQIKKHEQPSNFPFPCNDSDHNNASLEFVFPNGTKILLKNNIDISLLKAMVHLYD